MLLQSQNKLRYNKGIYESLVNLDCPVCTGKYCLRFLRTDLTSSLLSLHEKPQAILSRTDLAHGDRLLEREKLTLKKMKYKINMYTLRPKILVRIQIRVPVIKL